MTTLDVADEIEPPHLTIGEMVRRAVDLHGTGEALVDDTSRLSFIDLVAEIRQVARSLLALGVEHGDRVAVWAPNSRAWITAALGAQFIGGVLVPLNTRFKGAEAAHVLNAARVRVLVCHNGFLDADQVQDLARSAAEFTHLDHIIDLGSGTRARHVPAPLMTWQDFLALGTTVDENVVRARERAVRPADLCDIIFTSGTTGLPKGVMARHDQTVRVFWEWSRLVGLRSDDRYLIVNPFFHTFGYKAGFLACLFRGAVIVPQPIFDLPRVLERIGDERITALPGPPTIYLSILDDPHRSRFDLTTLRLAVTGAAAIPVEMIRRMREELSFTTIVTAYGLTESTGTVTMCRPDDDADTISRTSGRAITGVELRIVDDANSPVPAGTPGEIVCRGYNVMPGYYEDPAATAEVIDADGWLHTGDIGVLDERGYLAITDRKKDMFIVGGFNVYPAEVENALMAHPAISRIAVVGRPDERLGEVGHGFVVLRPDTTATDVTAGDLIAWSRERLANFKVPRDFTFVDELPMNASGKVLKYALRSRLTGETDS